jgi:hypothetical protein
MELCATRERKEMGAANAISSQYGYLLAGSTWRGLAGWLMQRQVAGARRIDDEGVRALDRGQTASSAALAGNPKGQKT